MMTVGNQFAVVSRRLVLQPATDCVKDHAVRTTSLLLFLIFLIVLPPPITWDYLHPDRMPIRASDQMILTLGIRISHWNETCSIPGFDGTQVDRNPRSDEL